MKNIILLIFTFIFFVFSSCDSAKKIVEDKLSDNSDSSEEVIADITGEKPQEDIDTTVVQLSKKEIKKLKKEREKQEKIASGDTIPFLKKKWKEFFPKREKRKISFPSIYSEKPKTILLLYPFNRSKKEEASQMYIINIQKELSQRGYYIIPASLTIEENRNDTLFSSKYVKPYEIKKYKDIYGADAVMFLTIYSLDKPWWSTKISSTAEYCLISTKTIDTLFYRKAEFNYDSPIPPYKAKKADDEYKIDKSNIPFFGACYKMQESVFMDFPYGPYNKKYLKDTNDFSYQKYMTYKIDARPS
ncbi:MAG: DUF799 family lipoprotein [Bacteroidales bacterium]|jgi:hypothetical protein|nr:DUF799 family lipoprotein [Bacteroidales bacterium]